MLPQFPQASSCRYGCSAKHRSGPSPGVTFHFLLPAALQARRPKGTTAPPSKLSGTATLLGCLQGTPHIPQNNRVVGNEKNKDLKPLLINQQRSLAGFSLRWAPAD